MKLIAEIIEGRPLIHVDASDSVRDASRRMSEKNIGAVAVLHAGKLVGVFSERDVMSRVVAEGLDPESTAVANVMTRNLIVGRPSDDIDAALEKMHAGGCRHLPIIDDQRNLVAMISLRDLLEVEDTLHRARATVLTELVTYRPDYES